MLYRREQYLQKIRPFYHDCGLIKIITGIRRCGKSCLLQTIAQELKEQGVPESDIIYLNLDQYGLQDIDTPRELDMLVQQRAAGDGRKYLFLDEIQNVSGFERLVNAYRETGRFSVFLTGSNSYLLSGELATKLTGRYVETEVFTLSYAEYLRMTGDDEGSMRAFRQYLTYGGFPKTVEYETDDAKRTYVENVVHQIFDKDVYARQRVRDRDAFDRVQTYVINNYAAPTNLTNIADYMTRTQGSPIIRRTVARYVRLLENAKLIYRCPRFDLKSRKSLQGWEKYYLADLGIYYARNTNTQTSYGPALENLVYTYLRGRGYAVSVGRIGRFECDFIVRKGDGYAYVQVSQTIADPKVEEREYRPLLSIRDNRPKYLFTLDPLPEQRDGIKHLNLMDFLAQDKDLEVG
ncbi:ATP-binding protein [Bifidobacterium phasiani]|uniref:ATP-binding protein n=1 Tax=Bifidobacterium phasiani TaxID=2834431 RepID=A0ABS6WB47_9BIFI|nr:ATP-binding protein [Bifidobacterium phasiani]MBW3083754.1 ATP-binding protein [Bifidobacterium phasiani]